MSRLNLPQPYIAFLSTILPQKISFIDLGVTPKTHRPAFATEPHEDLAGSPLIPFLPSTPNIPTPFARPFTPHFPRSCFHHFPPTRSAQPLGEELSDRELGSKRRYRKPTLIMIEPQSNTLSVAPNLHSLPKEVINHVCTYLSRTEIIELSRVARPLLYLAEEHIWEELSLFLPDHYGEYPLEQPYTPSDGAPYDKWCLEAANELSERRRKGLKRKLQTILYRAGEEEWSKVRDITMDLHPGSLVAVLQILDLSAATLTSLTISAAGDLADHPVLETLDVRLLTADIALSSLTSLVLGRGTFWLSATILLLVKLSPQLQSLDVNFERYSLNDPGELYEKVPDTALDGDTQIRNIRFFFVDCGEEEDVWAGQLLATIIQRSPKLRRASLGHTGITLNAIAAVLPALSAHRALTDLDFPISARIFCNHLDDDDPGFPALQRLVVRAESWANLSTRLPAFPKVERLYLDVGQLPELLSTAATVVPGAARALAIEPAVRDFLHSTPSLRAIHELHSQTAWRHEQVFWRFDNLEKSDMLSGSVHSLKHDDEELVHLRRLTHWAEVADCAWPMAGTVLASTATAIRYTTADGVERAKLVMVRSEAAWQDYTDYQGAIVPLPIIHAMREAEGASEEAWNNRGVQVGDEAWKVLTDWHAEYLAGQAAK